MRNMLLISQDLEVVDVVSRVAGRSGVDLLKPDTTAEASAAILEDPERFNLILLDLLPRAQRMAYLEQIRKWTESVPLIALTQLEDEMVGSIACAKGANEAVQKPLSEHMVEQMIDRF